MNLPLYMHDAFNFPVALVVGTAIGFAFGFVLERAGFGRASVLAAQFYFADTRVLKVMFSAIVTALLGVTVLDGIGVLDVGSITVPPTFVWPQLVGGLLLGVGFIISGYCPGTSVVAMASGKLDGLFTVLGVIAGSLLFGFGYDRIAAFQMSGALGPVTLPELLGVPRAVLALGVALMAIGAFVGAEMLERRNAARNGDSAPDSPRPVRGRVFAGFAAAAVAGIALLFVPVSTPASVDRTPDRIDALMLAQRIVEDPTGFYLFDLRPADARGDAGIPGALPLPEDADANFFRGLPPARDLIFFDARDAASLPAGANAFPGRVFVLTGGQEEFARRLLDEPVPPAAPTAAQAGEYALRAALHAKLTGSTAPTAPVEVKRVVVQTAKKKGGGC